MSYSIFNNFPKFYNFTLKVLGYQKTKLSFFTIITLTVLNIVRYGYFLDQSATPRVLLYLLKMQFLLLINVPTNNYIKHKNIKKLFNNLSEIDRKLSQLQSINYRKIRSQIKSVFIFTVIGLCYKLIQNQLIYTCCFNEDIVNFKYQQYLVSFFWIDAAIFYMPLAVFYTLMLIMWEFLNEISEHTVFEFNSKKGLNKNFRDIMSLYNMLLESVDLLCKAYSLPFFCNHVLHLAYISVDMFYIHQMNGKLNPLFNPAVLIEIVEQVLVLRSCEILQTMVRILD